MFESPPSRRIDTLLAHPRIHLPGAVEDEMAEILILSGERTRHGEVGEFRREQVEIEGQGRAQIGGPFHRSRIPGEPGRHLIGVSQVAQIRGGTEPIRLVEAPSPADGGEYLGEVGVATECVVNVVRRDDGDP